MTTNNRKLRLSVNPYLVDKAPHADKRSFSHGFHPTELSIEELAQAVSVDGFAFSYQYEDDQRSTAKFRATDFLAVDIDGGVRIEEMLEKPLVKSHCSLLYTTASHTPDHHRFRLVFTLPRTITKKYEVTAAARSLSKRLGGDPAATDAARIFFGSQGCNPIILDNSLTDELLDELILDGQVTPNRDSIAYPRSTLNRSNLRLDPNREVQTASGSSVKIGSIEKTTSVYCPFHHDRSPSAFVSRNKRQKTFLRCSSCQTTWWLTDQVDNHFEFYGFENTVKEINARRIHIPDTNTPFGDFVEILQLPPSHIQVVNDPYLEISKLDDGITFIRSPKGSGKTTYLARIIRKAICGFATLTEFEEDTDSSGGEVYLSNEKILLIGHRRALIGDLCSKLSLNCYLDDRKFRHGEIVERQKRYGICMDSLMKVRGMVYDTVVIDEVEQVLSHFLSDTIGEKRQTLFKMFCHQLQAAKKVVVLDADLSWVSFFTLTRLVHTIPASTDEQSNIPVHIYLNEYKNSNAEINIHDNEKHLIEHMQRSIAEGKRIFVTSNSKEKIKTLEKVVQKLAIDRDLELKVRVITSENSQAEDVQHFIKQIKNEILNYDVVLSSPSLGTGIDITFEGGEQKIDVVYGFFENLINSHFEIDQQLGRVRHPKAIHVWVSPATFKFETDFGVVRDDYLHDQLLDVSNHGYPSLTSLPDKDIDPFYIMAAMITTVQRASKNNLKRNFIEYKERNGWTAVYQDSDEEMIALGKEAFKYGKIAKDQDSTEQIMKAKTFNRIEYLDFKKRKDANDATTTPEEWHSFRKTRLELFYGEPVTEALIARDDRGNYSSKIWRYEGLLNMVEEAHSSGLVNSSSKNTALKKRLVKSSHEGTKILYQLLSATPIFANGRFKPHITFAKHDLSAFVVLCKQMSRQIETQLEISVRGDLDENPVRQLGDVLRLVGLKSKPTRHSNGQAERAYHYFLDNDVLKDVTTLVERRKIPEMMGWNYIDRAHGFEYTQDEWDLIMGSTPDGAQHQ